MSVYLTRLSVLLTASFVSFAALAQQSVGLVLSGGGAKGIAHIGVIQALEDNDIPIDYITGTSMG
ncbi:patatin-like phospholipase family protein, partial [uncultured Muribaculum sp.]|uniref:patatin-like phospholipase family protein n=1 Tax=uncultured Muribaculum sp. TaxID=1918613 RepID=UPI00351AA17A